ncbi:MAG: translational GTPase TypA, partial [Myxococcales bacterium]|nr:translational GTPase TypA [Myxococcales bacterium]
AHIDHGKTTLIDSIFRAAHTFRENARVAERVMDSMDLERERGITIRSKHCTVGWNDHKINIIDTPGHADFSGEVERVLSMVDSVLLLVDANEGPMPQTRYVLMRALRRGLLPIVLINKVDRPNANPQRALDATFDLFIELGASDAQADFDVLYGSGLRGWFVNKLSGDMAADSAKGMAAVFEAIIAHVPPPRVEADAPFRMQVSTLGWNEYIGRIGCGRVLSGSIRKGDELVRTQTKWLRPDRVGGWEVVDTTISKTTNLWTTEGLDTLDVDEIGAGDIAWIAGPADLSIGDTLSAPALAEPALQPLEIEQPTVSMFFLVNTGPFAGQDGDAVMIRQIRERLEREQRTNVALKVEESGRADALKVSGRGELHLAILIEEMRREGTELCVSRPEVITQQDDAGRLMEPMEEATIDVPEAYQGVVIEKLARRKGEPSGMHNGGTGIVRLEFRIPTRGLIGYRGEFLTDTRGLGVLTSRYVGYGPWVGEIAPRNRGSMISTDRGEATSYALENLQERGTLFVTPSTPVYAGMIVGEHARPMDMTCNPTKRKHVTNHRSATKEQTTVLDVPRVHSLDTALEWIGADELVEVTPKTIRIRKAFLNPDERRKAEKRKEAAAVA